MFEASFDLPATMVRERGRVIVRFAYLERYLQHIIYMLLETSAGIGRLAVREPNRLVDRLDLVLDIIAAKKLTIPKLDVELKILREAIEDAADMRNLCAHGTWMRVPDKGAWAVLVARGQWEGIPSFSALLPRLQ